MSRPAIYYEAMLLSLAALALLSTAASAQSLVLPAPASAGAFCPMIAPAFSFRLESPVLSLRPPRIAPPVGPASQVLRPSQGVFPSHESVPTAMLPDGTSLPPDSYLGGFHGTYLVSPEEVVRAGGLPARGPVEDWRLLEHALHQSVPVSAFRGTCPMAAGPSDGAAWWADEGGWVFELRGVPTWNVNSDLEGRIRGPGGRFRDNPARGENEGAVPARIPLECIPRWGRVSLARTGMPFVPASVWTANPAFDLDRCLKFWGR